MTVPDPVAIAAVSSAIAFGLVIGTLIWIFSAPLREPLVDRVDDLEGGRR